MSSYVDQYALEHLRMKYLSTDAKGRLRLLKRLQRTFWGVPNDIARLAVEDTDRRVRAWYARHEYWPSKEVVDKLRHDPDPLVRACFVEGKGEIFGIFPGWQSAPELERLAYLRRGYVPEDFILKLFDPENDELGLSQEDRTRYVLTFLAARAAPGKMERLSRGFDETELAAGEPIGAADLAGLTGGKLVELMPMWPKNVGIQDFVYRFCCPGEHVDVVYEHCDEPRWRRLLLENILSRGMWAYPDAEPMLALARRDPDDKCRELAHRDQRIGVTKRAVFEEALKLGDLAALRGLAQNKGLKRRQLRKVRRRAPSTDWLVQETLRAIREPRPERAETHERRTRQRPARQDSRIVQMKLDAVAHWIEAGLGLVIGTIWLGWSGSTVGLLAGTGIYLLTGSLPLGLFALASGLWAGISVAALASGFIWYRGRQPYPEKDRPRRREIPTREEDEEARKVMRVFRHAQQQDGEVDMEAERQRIERYKAAREAHPV